MLGLSGQDTTYRDKKARGMRLICLSPETEVKIIVPDFADSINTDLYCLGLPFHDKFLLLFGCISRRIHHIENTIARNLQRESQCLIIAYPPQLELILIPGLISFF